MRNHYNHKELIYYIFYMTYNRKNNKTNNKRKNINKQTIVINKINNHTHNVFISASKSKFIDNLNK